jgi:glycerol transport system ATP-binding protein
MSLKLEHVTRIVDGQVHIDDACLSFEPGSFNVLLGRTLAGKTSLMRLMAGLDRPSSGRVLMNGADVTGMPVRQRNVSMVYQQFINYPTLTVFENIASPLRQAGVAKEQIVEKVEATARMLRIDKLLSRYPLELSGGQQQRTAMARALVKDASLILFDEPLVNLDYKLREELRQEMRELFQARHTIAIYATTEPNEALALGGTTTILHEGRVVQSGKTAEVYHRPQQMLAAELFSEPAINLVPGRISGTEVSFADCVHFPLNPDQREAERGAKSEARQRRRERHPGVVDEAALRGHGLLDRGVPKLGDDLMRCGQLRLVLAPGVDHQLRGPELAVLPRGHVPRPGCVEPDRGRVPDRDDHRDDGQHGHDSSQRCHSMRISGTVSGGSGMISPPTGLKPSRR